MGIFDSIGDFFSGSDAASRAARVQNQGINRGIDEQRSMFDEVQQLLSPFIDAGQGALQNLSGGLTAGGLDDRLGEIFNTNTFGNLVDERERSVRGQLAAGGLNRSGTAVNAIADVPTQLGLMLENMLFGRNQDLASAGQNAATGQANIGTQTSGNIAGMLGRQGVNTGSGIITDQQSQQQGLGNIIKTAAGFFFSDPRLKTDVEHIGELGDLKLYTWEWRPEFEGTIVMQCAKTGFMADEVEEKYPHHVTEYAGIKVIDYPELLDEMEAKTWLH